MTLENMTAQTESKGPSIRDFFKRWPTFYYLVEIVFGHTLLLGMNPKDFLRKYAAEGEVINVGSGPRRLGPEVKNVDKFQYEGVDILSDIEDMQPFGDASVARIVCDNVLEHLPHPYKAVSELKRILKPGGFLYISTPFYYPFHPSPSDFTRWTKEGLLQLFEEFEVMEVGVRSGPFSSLTVTLSYLFATVFSFGNDFLYWFLLDASMFLFFPIKFLDVFVNRLPHAANMAAVLYLVVKKR